MRGFLIYIFYNVTAKSVHSSWVHTFLREHIFKRLLIVSPFVSVWNHVSKRHNNLNADIYKHKNWYLLIWRYGFEGKIKLNYKKAKKK